MKSFLIFATVIIISGVVLVFLGSAHTTTANYASTAKVTSTAVPATTPEFPFTWAIIPQGGGIIETIEKKDKSNIREYFGLAVVMVRDGKQKIMFENIKALSFSGKLPQLLNPQPGDIIYWGKTEEIKRSIQDGNVIKAKGGYDVDKKVNYLEITGGVKTPISVVLKNEKWYYYANGIEYQTPEEVLKIIQ